MSILRALPTLALAAVLAAALPAQGGLGRGKGGGGGSNPPSSPRPSSPPSNPPRRSDPPPRRVEPSAPRSQPSSSPGTDRGRDRSPTRTSPSNTPQPTYPSQGSSPRPSGPLGSQAGGAGQRPERVGGLGRNGGTSRSGRVQYGTVNNSTRVGSPIRIDRAPTFINGNALPSRVYRQDRVGVVNGYRNGYYHYNRSWRDDNFYFPYYSFNPYNGISVISPFYGYAFVPGYIGYNNVTIINTYQSPWIWQNGVVYNWDNGYRNGTYFNDDRREDRAARDAVDDLRDGFERNEARTLSRLVGRSGQVAILRDGRYDYSVNVDEFDDLLRDLASNSRTQSYRVIDSRVYRNSIRLVAQHNYIDPWGQGQTLYHHILLTPERGEYVIREFGTSPSRNW